MKKFECPHDCNARCPDKKFQICGYSCYIDKAHDLNDRRCDRHFDVKENLKEFSSSASSSWQRESSFKVPVAPNLEVQDQQSKEQQPERTWTAQQGQALQRAYELVTNYEKDNHIGEIKDEWEEYQFWLLKREEQKQRSPESTSSEQTRRIQSKRRNRKETTPSVKIKVIRLNTEVPKERNEIVLIPAPRVLAEREGREMPIEVPDEDERPEERPIEGPGAHEMTIAGRYAVDSDTKFAERLVEAEADEDLLQSAVETEARRKVGYFEFLQGQLAKLNLPRNKDLNLLERFRSMKGTSTSSSSKEPEKEEFFSPSKKPEKEEFFSPQPCPREESKEDEEEAKDEVNEELQRKIDEGGKIPVWEDPQLEDLIDLRLEEIRKETGREDEPKEELERIQAKVTSKSQLVWEIPMPTKDPKLVEEVIKLFIAHVESKSWSNTKIAGLQTLIEKPKIPNDYEELNKSLQEWYSQRNSKRPSEEPSESSDKKVKLNMIKGSFEETAQSERPRYEDLEEEGYKIGSLGEAAKQVKDQNIAEIDTEQEILVKGQT